VKILLILALYSLMCESTVTTTVEITVPCVSIVEYSDSACSEAVQGSILTVSTCTQSYLGYYQQVGSDGTLSYNCTDNTCTNCSNSAVIAHNGCYQIDTCTYVTSTPIEQNVVHITLYLDASCDSLFHTTEPGQYGNCVPLTYAGDNYLNVMAYAVPNDEVILFSFKDESCTSGISLLTSTPLTLGNCYSYETDASVKVSGGSITSYALPLLFLTIFLILL